MVIAADDGVMPQTREHAAVLAALGVTPGVVAITKTDLADPARASRRPRELLPGAETCRSRRAPAPGWTSCARRWSARPAACRRAVADGAAAAARRPRRSACTARDGRDRHAVVGRGGARRAGRGAAVAAGAARVRGVEVHDEAVERAEAGQRVALNLAGLERDEVARGDVDRRRRAPPPRLPPRRRAGLGRASGRTTARGSPSTTARARRAARLVELGGRFFQLRLEQPIWPRRGDRLVIRSLAPPDTLGGGVVLDPRRARHGPSRDLLARLARRRAGRPEPAPPPQPRRAARTRAAAHAEALDARGAPARRRLRAAAETTRPTPRRSPRCARTAAPTGSAATCTSTPTRSRTCAARVDAIIERDGEITLARPRDELGTSRKYAQALLEHLDAARVTIRARRRARAQAPAGRGAVGSSPSPPRCSRAM